MAIITKRERENMKKGNLIAITLLASTLLIGGCTPKEKTSSGADASETSQKQELPSYLNFLKANQIRFDIMNDDLGLTFTYQDKAITNGTTLDIVEGELTSSGETTKEKLNFIMVCQKKATGDSVGETNLHVAKGLRVSALSNYLEKFGRNYINPYVGGRVYVAISDGSDNPKWTTGLNEEMDKAIKFEINRTITI